MTDRNEFELYIHIPFCIKKCNYCDFLSFATSDDIKERYVRSLINQIKHEASNIVNHSAVRSVYIGGGTPTILEGEYLVDIINAIRGNYLLTKDCEITVEVNPGTVDLCKLIKLKKAGVNRISIGMQSADDEELRLLGRIHTYEEFEACYKAVRSAGFTNINVDVMTALPNQSSSKLINTLDKVIGLDPEHISAYSLIIEEGTPFYESYGHLEEPVVGQELERQLYWLCVKRLKAAGYEQYEISNFAKKGYASRHNSGYWHRVPYLGLGLGASSLVDSSMYDFYRLQLDEATECRIRNTTDMEEYLSDFTNKEECVALSDNDAIEEYMFLGLRMLGGISNKAFKEKFGKDILDIYSEPINKLINERLLAHQNDVYKLTNKGIDYGNYVFSRFLL